MKGDYFLKLWLRLLNMMHTLSKRKVSLDCRTLKNALQHLKCLHMPLTNIVVMGEHDYGVHEALCCCNLCLLSWWVLARANYIIDIAKKMKIHEDKGWCGMFITSMTCITIGTIAQLHGMVTLVTKMTIKTSFLKHLLIKVYGFGIF